MTHIRIINGNVNDVLKAFENVLLSCSEFLKYTKSRHKRNIDKTWFDKDCKVAKSKAGHSLKNFRASKKVEDLNKYITDKNTTYLMVATAGA